MGGRWAGLQASPCPELILIPNSSTTTKERGPKQLPYHMARTRTATTRLMVNTLVPTRHLNTRWPPRNSRSAIPSSDNMAPITLRIKYTPSPLPTKSLSSSQIIVRILKLTYCRINIAIQFNERISLPNQSAPSERSYFRGRQQRSLARIPHRATPESPGL